MDEYLRYGLLVVAALILSFIIVESWWRRRRFKVAEMNVQEFKPIRSAPQLTDEGCTINLPPTEDVLNISSHINMPSSETEIRKEPSIQPTQDYLAISVFAQPNTHFESYDLLQAISATGMQFGEMNIFHYYETSNGKKESLFSLASATKPGEFNLDRMGDFSCAGLTLFLDLGSVSNPKMAFDKMLATAEHLADDLDGELRAGNRTPWCDDMLQQYKQRVQRFSK